MKRIKQGYKKNLKLKRELRLNMTPAENRLWLQLKGNQFKSLKFRRQHGIGPYIVDFYCPSANLTIEVDGDVHAFPEQSKKDLERGKYLQNLGVKVIRYNNDDILKNLDGVLEDLYEKII